MLYGKLKGTSRKSCTRYKERVKYSKWLSRWNFDLEEREFIKKNKYSKWSEEKMKFNNLTMEEVTRFWVLFSHIKYMAIV